HRTAAAGGHRRTSPHRHDASAQSAGRGADVSDIALLGERRTVPGDEPLARRADGSAFGSGGRAAGSAPNPDGRRRVSDECGDAVLPADARDDDRPRSRRNPAARKRLLDDVLRDARARPAMARILRIPRPDNALRVSSYPTQGPAISAWWAALAAEVAAAS